MQMSKENKQVVFLCISTFLGLLLGVFSSIINTRNLSPEFYGDVKYVQNIISFVSSLLLFGYFTSGSRLLALSKNETNSRSIRGIMCFILLLAILVVTLTLFVFYLINAQCQNYNMAYLFLAAMPFCGCVLMLSYVNTVAQGDNHIGRIAVARLLPSLIYCLIAYFIFKFYGATSIRMILLYNGVSFFVLLGVILSTKPSFKSLKKSFDILNVENRKYGIHVYIGSLFGVSVSYISGITLGLFADNNSNVGFYSLAATVATPLAMLPSIIGTTYFKKFASQKSINKKVIFASVFLTVSTCIAFIFLVKYVVLFLYDNSYSSVYVYASWLAIGTSFHGLGDFFNRFLGSHGQGMQIRNAAIACGIISILGGTILVYFYGIFGAIYTNILSSLTYLGLLIFYYIKYISIK